MHHRTIIASAALALATSAWAVPDNPVIDLSSGAGSFTGTVTGRVPNPLTDSFSFTLTDPVAALSSVVFSVAMGRRDIDFTSITLSGGSLSSALSFSKLLGDPTESWTLASNTLLAAGSYMLDLTYTKTGFGTATYAGVLSVTPVPEPETYALMLAGLGAIGFLLARRRRED